MTTPPKITTSPTLLPTARIQPDAVIKVELDERAYLFPVGRQVTHLQLIVHRPHVLKVEAVFLFNESKASPELLTLGQEDARALSRRIVECVYRAQSAQVISPGTSLAFNVVTNGYVLEFGPPENPSELMLSTGCIWRVCNGLARAVDFMSPVASN